MTIILGIDPGSRVTGYGCVKVDGNHYQYVTSGVIKTDLDETMSQRLRDIYLGLQSVIETYRPHEVAIEDIFFHNNAKSALKLGQARGAAIVAVATLGFPLAEYSARTVKQSVVGYGAATKDQIQHMVKRLLNLQGALQADAADALAVAICHGQNRRLSALYAKGFMGVTR
jgi:crossover junction endodeoxyribonuclease RuvC